MAYDEVNRETVLFGGTGRTLPALAETWSWNGSTWRQRVVTPVPPARFGHSMVTMTGQGKVLVFGGWDVLGQPLNDLWEWDGRQWVQRMTTVAPPGRSYSGLCHDARRNRVVLFGGDGGTRTGSVIPLQDTWEWDGRWVQAHPTIRPAARWAPSLVYDVARERTVLFGGHDGAFRRFGDTWEWDGVAWIRRAPPRAPQARWAHTSAYHASLEVICLFGGFGDAGEDTRTWVYGPTHRATSLEFGAGCSGPGGVPRLGSVAGERPWLGSDYELEISNLPPSSLGFLFLGFSNTRWGSVPLPFDLTPLGMTGCSLLVEVPILFPFASRGGRTTLSLAISDRPDLLGFQFFDQALVIDPAANPFGATVSNGLASTLGGR
jgi:hypothetical protein